MVFGGAMGLVGAEKFIKQKGMLSKPSRHMVAIYGTSFLTAFVGKELGKIYGTKQNISKAVYSGHFQNTLPGGGLSLFFQFENSKVSEKISTKFSFFHFRWVRPWVWILKKQP